MKMKTILSLILTAAALCAQASIVIRVTEVDGTLHVAKITGQPAAAGLEILKAWMATQQVCTPVPAVQEVRDVDGNVTTPGVPASQNCVPKYANPAEVPKASTIAILEQLIDRGYTSSATKADTDEIAAKTAALKAKRKALLDAAKGEK